MIRRTKPAVMAIRPTRRVIINFRPIRQRSEWVNRRKNKERVEFNQTVPKKTVEQSGW
jgi:hypothetical protein